MNSSNHNESKLFVIALRAGRMANRLVLFANFIAYAEEHGHRVSNVTFHSYSNWFETTRRDIYCRYPVPARRSVFNLLPGAAPTICATRIFYRLVRAAAVLNESTRLLDSRVATLREIKGRDVTPLDSPEVQAQIAQARTVFVYGWRFRAGDLVRKHAEKIRTHLRPLQSTQREIEEKFHSIRRRTDVVIGVHMRQGDYRTWHDGKYFFDAARYAGWMREVMAQFPGRRVSFIVSSDEPRHCDEFAGLDVEISSGPAVNDLFTLAGCDFLIGPPSTFSQWASFHGNAPLLHLRAKEDRVERARFQVSYFESIT